MIGDTMAFGLVWSWGYVITIIIFSIIIGLLFYFNEASNKTLAKYVVISVICTALIVYLINLFKNQLFSAIGIYNYTLIFLISFVLIFIGYLLSKQKDLMGCFNKVVSLSFLCFLLIAFVCSLSNMDLFGFNSLQISLFTTILFNLGIIGTFFAVKKFNLAGKSIKRLRDLYFIFGVYFLMVSLFLPNIISLDMANMKPINIVSIESIVITSVFLIVVIVLGLWYSRKNTLLK